MRTRPLELELSAPVHQALRRLVASGLYGRTEAQAAERLICHRLEELLAMPLLQERREEA